jgi:crotonobetainyl-CoA:carnitine CoA-transferase CaiB-like acyl-CoA transferase
VTVRFSENALRIEHRKALREEIEHSIGAMIRSYLCNQLMENGVPGGPINSVSEAISQPTHYIGRWPFFVMDTEGSVFRYAWRKPRASRERTRGRSMPIPELCLGTQAIRRMRWSN